MTGVLVWAPQCCVVKSKCVHWSPGNIPRKEKDVSFSNSEGFGWLWFSVGRRQKHFHVSFVKSSDCRNLPLLTSIDPHRSSGGNSIFVELFVKVCFILFASFQPCSLSLGQKLSWLFETTQASPTLLLQGSVVIAHLLTMDPFFQYAYMSRMVAMVCVRAHVCV